MTLACIDKLIKEDDRVLLRERRTADRKPFMRPVSIASGRNANQIDEAFSRDISPIGIGIISRVNWAKGTRVRLTIHTLTLRERICVTAEARWSEPYGEGWFLTGWRFVDER